MHPTNIIKLYVMKVEKSDPDLNDFIKEHFIRTNVSAGDADTIATTLELVKTKLELLTLEDPDRPRKCVYFSCTFMV